MNTEQAIEVIECEKGCAEADLANNEGHINTERFIDACNMALAALRNQQEREKGCEYCLGDRMYGAISFPKTTDGEIKIKDIEAIEAEYCPMCGRKIDQRCD